MKSRRLLIILGLILVVITGTAIFVMMRVGERLGEERASPDTSAPVAQVESNQQVRRLLLKRIVNGEVEYVEILSNGEVIVYDAQMNRKKSGLMGIARVRSLFGGIEKHLGKKNQNLIVNCLGAVTITVETEQGTTIITGNDNCATSPPPSPWQPIIKEIDDTINPIINPSPTRIPSATPILPPQLVSPTPTTTVPLGYPTPTGLPGSPTLPAYRTAPPFTCDEYKYLHRPVNISNVICGAD